MLIATDKRGYPHIFLISPRKYMLWVLIRSAANLLLCVLVAYLGLVVQSVVSLTSLLRVISLTVLADSIYNILIFFAEKM